MDIGTEESIRTWFTSSSTLILQKRENIEKRERKKNAYGAGNIQHNADQRASQPILHLSLSPSIGELIDGNSSRPLRLVPIRVLQECTQDLAASLCVCGHMGRGIEPETKEDQF